MIACPQPETLRRPTQHRDSLVDAPTTPGACPLLCSKAQGSPSALSPVSPRTICSSDPLLSERLTWRVGVLACLGPYLR